jgi:predicted RNase H-like nuclease (RuvC/YqgF family)
MRVKHTYLKVNSMGQVDRELKTDIDKELDSTLMQDRDFNDTLSLKEYYSTEDDVNNYKKAIYNNAKAHISKAMQEAIYEEKAEEARKAEEKKLKDGLERLVESREIERALERLMEENSDISKLTDDEMKLISEDIKEFRQEDGTYKIDKKRLKEIIANYNKKIKNRSEQIANLQKRAEDKNDISKVKESNKNIGAIDIYNQNSMIGGSSFRGVA